MFSMKLFPSETAADADLNSTCPNCGGTDHEDNRLDDALHRAAALEAPRLRHEGHNDEAIDVLTALAAVEIANFIRLRWRCIQCGARFDA